MPDDNVRSFPAGAESTGLATCQMCGQTMTVDLSQFESQAAADDYATGACSCPDGEDEREVSRWKRDRQINLAKAAAQIEELFGSGAPGYGLIPAIDEVKGMLNVAAELVYDDKIRDTTISINSCVKAKVFITAKGKLMIRRSDTAVYTQEI